MATLQVPNVTTFPATVAEIKAIDQVRADLAIGSRSSFIRNLVMTFVRQTQAGEAPDWPPRYIPRAEILKAPPRPGKARPKRKRPGKE